MSLHLLRLLHGLHSFTRVRYRHDMASRLKSNLKEGEGTIGTKKTLRWASDIVDKAPKKPTPAAPTADAAVANSVNQVSNRKVKPRLCSFCGKNPACLRMKPSWKGKDQKQSLCLLHYYTTSAIHADSSDHIVILDPTLLKAQLNGENEINKKNKLNVQDLFAEAYCQLQSELAQESLNISVGPAEGNKKKGGRRPSFPPTNDPLSILHDLGRSSKKRKIPPVTSTSSKDFKWQGGFLAPVPLPERLRKTQQQQAKWQAEQLACMNSVAKTGQAADASKRRQHSRKTIWNSVMDGGSESKHGKQSTKANHFRRKLPNRTYNEIDLTVDDVTCSCGSNDVVDVGNVTSRDTKKGEVWGSGGRDDEVVLRYRCNKCGKTWQETG